MSNAILGLEMTGWDQLAALRTRSPDIVQEEIGSFVRDVDLLLERESKERFPTATGAARASVFSQEEVFPDGAIGIVGSPLLYVAYVELGTAPHFPPLQPLEDWVRIKLDVPEDQVEGVALAIARKIAQRGTLGVGMFHGAWAAQAENVEARFALARDRIVNRVLDAAS